MLEKINPEMARDKITEKKTEPLLSDDTLENVNGGIYYGIQTHDAWCAVCNRVTRHNIQNWCIEHNW